MRIFCKVIEYEILKVEFINIIKLMIYFKVDYSQTDQLISDQFEKISNDIQNLSFFIRSLNFLLTSNGSNDQSIKSSDDLMRKLGQTAKTDIKLKLKVEQILFIVGYLCL
jgi:hypothetical protein